jgi:hypothetical protein
LIKYLIMLLKEYIKNKLRTELVENQNKNEVSVEHLKGLLKQTSHPKSKEILNDFIKKAKDKDSVILNDKQYSLLNLIKTGSFKPTSYSTKN